MVLPLHTRKQVNHDTRTLTLSESAALLHALVWDCVVLFLFFIPDRNNSVIFWLIIFRTVSECVYVYLCVNLIE